MIIKNDISQMLAAAENDLAEKVSKRDSLNIEIIQAQHQIRALRVLAAQDAIGAKVRGHEDAIVGLSEAIRSVLRRRRSAMTAANVKNDLDFLGFDFSNFSNASAAVHNTLKRMAGTGELGYDVNNKTYQIPPHGFVPMNVPARR